eukprot:TRINITY_DN188_c0_g2_i1.p1 TRINITY_DN188_c0_g2~~TRINITY_DN188_c0_g2_i1.p1  ORF type:complete len:409 (+),score=148.17 TRINITY_DN188_c0_g2_i1:25-1251(+)
MSNKLPGANDVEKLKNLSTKTHKEQAIWFLNAFWEDDSGTPEQAEQIWKYVNHLQKLDPNAAEGTDVDELIMHRFLEFFQETLTVREMRDSLRDTGAVTDTRMKNISLSHYLIFRYKKNFHSLVNSIQGSNQKEIDRAEALLKEVQAAFNAADERSKEAKVAHNEAQKAESAAKAREAEAKAAEATAKSREAEAKSAEASAKTRETEAKDREAEAITAKQELETALKELKEQEDAFTNRTNQLTAKSEDESSGAVTRNKAKAELAQHLASDPLPLRRAKITQEAAVKKAEKATIAASEARSKSETARAEAEKAARQAEESRREAENQARQAEQARHAAEESARAAAAAKTAAEEAVEETFRKVQEAESYLEEVKAQPGSAHGAVWWMERQLHETKAYLPERKGGYKKN